MSILTEIYKRLGHGGSLVVSVYAFNYDDRSSNTA